MEKKTILVVEDEIVIAMDLQAILIDLGYRVPEIITSGENAVEKALELRPDLILMDIHLSDQMDGIEAANRIIQTLDIPIIYLTAYADEETLQRASRTVPFGYILKPFEVRELRASLEIAFYKHHLDQLVKESQRWLLAVLNSISEGVAASDANGLIKFMNPVAEALTGWPQAEAIGQSPQAVFRFINEFTREPIASPLLQALQQDSSVHLPDNVLLLDRQDNETPVADSASPIRNGQNLPEGAVMVFRDVTDQRQIQAQLEHSALHDALTQLPNRALFLDRLQQAIDRDQRVPEFGFAVMLLDLDRFKVINDTFGHGVGDQLLMAVAPRFRSHLRSMDTVARLGGDEFALLLEDVRDVAIACRTAERLLEELQIPFTIGSHEFLVTASVGIVLSSMPYTQATDLLRDADIALYRAKSQGRNCYEIFDTAMHLQARYLMQLEHDLKRAIAREELRVHYQPIVSLETMAVISVEALVRWQRSGSELIYPDQFIALAEETGLIGAIDRWVFQAACRQLKQWQPLSNASWIIELGSPARLSDQSTPPFTMAVNVNLSSKQFVQENLVDIFAQILQEAGLSGHRLKLEVTESVFIENAAEAAKTLAQLKALGIQVCLDDFGTGYSSLSYLHKFPIDLVKIDRSFIQGMEADAEKLEIVRAIIELCRILGMETAAEGVETIEQAEMLLDLGCQYGQGHLFARAIEGAVITQILAASQPC